MKTGFTKRLAGWSFALLACLTFTFQTNAQTPFYSEDFGGGLPAGWTTDDLNDNMPEVVWTYCSDPAGGTAVAGCHRVWDDGLNAQLPFASTTSANGFLTVDSDAAGNVDHVSVVTSAAIDCSGQPTVVARFETHIGVFTIDAEVGALLQVSTDGTNFTDFTIFPGLTAGGAGNDGVTRWSLNPTIVEVDISSVAGNESQVFLRWSWEGNYEYHWNIDDVVLQDAVTPPPVNETSVAFTIHATNFSTPRVHLEPFEFAGFASNNGTADQANLTLQTTITNNAGTTVYDESGVLGLVPSGTVDTLIEMPNTYTPPAMTDEYIVNYNLFQNDADEFPGDNSAQNRFVVSDNIFSKDNDIITTGFSPNDDAGNGVNAYQAGVFYNLTQADSVTNITFSMAENDDILDGKSVTLLLYQVNCDIFGDANCRDNFDDTQISPVALAFYTFGPDDANFDLITVPLIDFFTFGDGPLEVAAGTYIAMVDVAQGPDDPTLFTSVSDPGYSPAQIFSAVRFGGPIGGAGGAETWRLTGFGAEGGIVMRLGVVGDGMTTGLLDPVELAADLNIFPTPADEIVTVDLRLETAATNATVQILDINGRVVSRQIFENLSREVMTFDVSSMPAGSYIFNVTTAQGVKTKRFIVAH